MSINFGPTPIQQGLLLHYDMSNTQKSFLGQPTTNTATNVNIGFGGERWSNVTNSNYPDKTRLPFNLKGSVWRLSNGNNYFGYASEYGLTAGNTYTISFWYNVSTVQNMIWNNDVWNSSYGSVVGSVSANTFVTTNQTGGWRYGYKTFTISGGTSPFYVRGTITDGGGDTTPTGDVYIANFQIENTSIPTPYVNGTRSISQAITDLASKNTFTATNLVYNNDNTFNFNGSTSLITIPNNTVFDTEALTIESWSYPTTVFQNGFLFEKGTVNTQYSNFYNSDGTFYFRTMGLSNQDTTIYGPSYITANAWNHIVCTYGAGIKNIYVNGVLAAQTTGITGTLSTNASGMSIGVYGGETGGRGYYFSGRIGMSKFYNRALTAAEITQNFNADRGRFGR